MIESPGIMATTLGGKQLWADVWFFRSWRIQRSAVTGSYRLLDEKNRRHAAGTFDACREVFAARRAQHGLPPMRGEVVVVLHGLFRTRASMRRMCRFLQQEGGYLVFNVSYPSTRGTVGDHAHDLARIVDSLVGIETIHFVAHSLGNLVIRHWMADQAVRLAGMRTGPHSAPATANGRNTKSPEGDAAPAGKRVPLGRMVILGPPNQGAHLAERFIPLDWTGQITGPAAGQLATGWDRLAPHLATPPCPFGILAGGSRRGRGRNPLLPGDDDWVVAVDSTRLAGARDFRVLPVWHTTMMNSARVQRATLRFLTEGHFESEVTRQPIGADR